jgi:hypothetical protein
MKAVLRDRFDVIRDRSGVIIEQRRENLFLTLSVGISLIMDYLSK